MSHSAFKFDNDEVINGLIWSEILSKTETTLNDAFNLITSLFNYKLKLRE